MYVNYANVEETALNPQHAHSVVNRSPVKHATLHPPHHDKSCAKLMCFAAALVDGVPTKRTHMFPLPTNLLQRYDVKFAVFHYIR